MALIFVEGRSRKMIGDLPLELRKKWFGLNNINLNIALFPFFSFFCLTTFQILSKMSFPVRSLIFLAAVTCFFKSPVVFFFFFFFLQLLCTFILLSGAFVETLL